MLQTVLKNGAPYDSGGEITNCREHVDRMSCEDITGNSVSSRSTITAGFHNWKSRNQAECLYLKIHKNPHRANPAELLSTHVAFRS